MSRSTALAAFPFFVVASCCASNTTCDCFDNETGDLDSLEIEDLEFIDIEPGEFRMGFDVSDYGYSEDSEAHSVSLTHRFQILATELTRTQYGLITGEYPSSSVGCEEDCPVESITWHQAAYVSNLLSESACLSPCYQCDHSSTDTVCESVEAPYGCAGYRLPTEAEWEYAARAGAVTQYQNGGNLQSNWDMSECDPDIVLDNGTYLSGIAIYCGNSEREPASVYSVESNAWGVFGVHGNVFEWCHDWYSPYQGDEVDPFGPETGSYRVSRSGGYRTTPVGVSLSARSPWFQDANTSAYGMRVARTLP